MNRGKEAGQNYFNGFSAESSSLGQMHHFWHTNNMLP